MGNENLPDWLTRALIVGMLGWVVFATAQNSTKIEGIDARVTMLVQFMMPEMRRVEARP